MILILCVLILFVIFLIPRIKRPVNQFRFAITQFDFEVENHDDLASYGDENLSMFYITLLWECLKNMNKKNKALVFNYFCSPGFYESLKETFINIVWVEYINNLSKEEVQDIADTGYFAPFTVKEAQNIPAVSVDHICVGSIKYFETSLSVNWNKLSTISSLVSLLISFNMLSFFQSKMEKPEQLPLNIMHYLQHWVPEHGSYGIEKE